MEESKKSGGGLGSMAGAIVGGLSTIGGWLGIGEKRQDRRQISQQEKLNDVNKKTAKEMADYEQNLKYDMWDKTNLSAQLQQAKKAGVSKAAAIGGSGTGTQGASVGNVGGGQAADAASAMNASTNQSATGVQTATQLAMAKAQIENIEANTEKTKVDAAKAAGIDTDIANENWRKINRENETFDNAGGVEEAGATLARANQIIKTQSEKEYNDYETFKAAGYAGKNNNDPTSPVGLAIKAGMDKTIQEAKNAKKDGRIKDAEAKVKEFEGKMADQGIAPNSPWGVKLAADLSEAVGLTGWIKKKAKDVHK